MGSFSERHFDLFLIPQQPNETVRGWAYRLLLENIISLRLPPGTFFTEQELAQMLQASRTPVREALIQLAGDGFVEITSQRGTRVSLIDLQRVEDERFMRMCLEQKTALLGAKAFPDESLIRLQYFYDMMDVAFKQKDGLRFIEFDDKFHQAVLTGSGRPGIWCAITKFSGHHRRARILSRISHQGRNHGYPDEWLSAMRQHMQILEALRSHDARSAASAIEEHFSPSGWDVGKLRETYSDYFVSGSGLG